MPVGPGFGITIPAGVTCYRMTSLAFSPDGKRLYYGTKDGSVRVWDLARWPSDAANPFGPHTGAVDSLAAATEVSVPLRTYSTKLFKA